MYNLLNNVKEKNPLVLHYTNEVTINDCANVTLAIGASPLMSYSYEEAQELIKICDSVIINIGTMNSKYIDLFKKATKIANEYNKPIVLDIVGVFASSSRKKLVEEILDNSYIDIIKGNYAEIKFIGGFDTLGKGVDSDEKYDGIENICKNIATKKKCIVVATGKYDIITNGVKILKIDNGTEKLKLITGTGCMISSLIGSFVGANSNDKINAVTMGVLTMSLSGEIVDKDDIGTATFRVLLMDKIGKLKTVDFEKYAKVGDL